MKRFLSPFLFALLLFAITFPFLWLTTSYHPQSGILNLNFDLARGWKFFSGLIPILIAVSGIMLVTRGIRAVPAIGEKWNLVSSTLQHCAQHRSFPFLLFLFAGSLAFILKSNHLNIAIMVGIYMILTLGLNITIGMTGLLVLGYAGFFALGGYTFAILQQFFPGVTWWMTLPLAILIGTVAGVIVGLPCLRLRGDYLAIVTLGFAESFRECTRNLPQLTGGDLGIIIQASSKIQRHFGLSSLQSGYLILLVFVFASVFMITRLYHSPLGRAWNAIRENEVAANAMGISVVKLKLLAFALSAGFAALAGVLYTAHIGFINPESSAFENSVLVLAMVILGGLGSIPGALIGSALLYLIPSLFRDNLPALADYRLFLFGAIMVVMMLYRPQGMLGTKDRT